MDKFEKNGPFPRTPDDDAEERIRDAAGVFDGIEIESVGRERRRRIH
ncbi:MAG TPA: hypothetical protein VNM40_00475 [Candidatus Paceibacterota bacterium]|nr:hypothetical protein [Candidatus Paceibacterota bacterium]